MPLVRFEVRNEYRLGQPELYKQANREDPKTVLDGVAVSGLVGILRQLGDLAEFAAEVFHGLQEQVMTTAYRSHKLMVRVQNIEAALPSLEKAVLAQTSHIHFAYTAGSEWHSRIQNRQNHFIYNDLPRFIMDSYEECRDPPRLHLLDKFDTGGPGSCLKRYSDPTFFRRASGNFKEPDPEKVPKEKKTRKNKKKRSSQRKSDFLQSTSMSNQSAGMQFTAPVANGRTSPSRTASTIDMTLNSDLGDHSNSFDSKTGSAYVECVFHLSSSVQAEEQECKEFSSGSVDHNNITDSVFPGGQPSIATENFPRSSPEPIAPSSSYDTWDEKTEIVEPKGLETLDCGGNEAPEMFTTNLDIGIQNRDISSFKNPDQMDRMFGDENMQKSSTGRDELDEVESEPDNYMDALNTIESESENDLDYQTKHEVEQFSSDVHNEGVEDEINRVRQDSSDDYTSKCESNIASDISVNNGVAFDLPNSASLNNVSDEHYSFADEHISHVSGEPSYSDNLPDSGSSISADVLDGSKVESTVNDLSSCGYGISNLMEPSSDKTVSSSCMSQEPAPPSDKTVSSSCKSQESAPPSDKTVISSCKSQEPAAPPSDKTVISSCKSQEPAPPSDKTVISSCNSQEPAPPSDKTISSSCKSQEPAMSQEFQTELSSVHSVSFWTNGGLLGLQPSKPPDFAVANPSSQDSITSEPNVLVPPNQTSTSNNNGERGRPGKLFKDVGSMERVPSIEHSNSQHEDKDAEIEKSGDNRFNHAYGGGMNVVSIMNPGKELPLNADVKATCTKTSQENDENSSQVFGLGHRLLINGLRRKMSLEPAGKPELASTPRIGTLEQRNGHHNVAHHETSQNAFSEKFGHKSTVDSLTSSPPLEHMKMSFHPIDGFEASSLKLKFPYGNHSTGSIRDMFPSFQLVPDSTIPMQNVGSDSDDDTFCRSSPYMSDDYISHHSDSDSEQWESGESPGNKDHELYDALCRMSSVGSVSSSLQPGTMNNNDININSALRSVYTENGSDPSLSSSVLDLPSFDAVDPVLQGKSKDNLDTSNLIGLQYLRDSNPSPPPPPPVQWWVTKPASCLAEDTQNTISEVVNEQHAVDLKLSGSTVSHQHELTPANEQQTDEAFPFKPKGKLDQWNLNVQKEATLPANGKGMDEKEDFLHQIRTKSFSLRRTVTARPTFASGPAANDKVTAILEKANAIRQAVGSDDGEDDDDETWSDT